MFVKIYHRSYATPENVFVQIDHRSQAIPAILDFAIMKNKSLSKTHMGESALDI